MNNEYYNLLGVNKNSSQDDIKKAYRKLVKEHHPDRGGNEETFKKVSEAYGVLSDPQKRKQYDRYGKNVNRGGHQQGFNMDDIFDHFNFDFGDIFGGNRKRRKAKAR